MRTPIASLHTLDFVPRPSEHVATDAATAARFDASRAALGKALGLSKLGVNVTAAKPGKAAYPFHSHHAEEEMFFILRGTGLLRYGGETRRIRAGDFIGCPTGGPETAHQIVNDSDAPLEFISVSTMMPAEVCEYPDSGKIGAYCGGGGGDKGLMHLSRSADATDYWAGE